MTRAGEPLLELDAVSRAFRLRDGALLHACTDVSLSLSAGSALGLVGESGSGKTTLARIALGLIEPTAGHVRFAGERIDGLRRSGLRGFRRRAQIVFQDPLDSLNPSLSAGRAIEEPLRVHRLPAGSDAVADALVRVGLDPAVACSRPAGLSAGEAQRVAIARALATGPELVVLDEPTSALTDAAEDEILDLLARLRAELGLAYLFVSHDLSLVRRVCDDVAVMYLGELVETGSVEQVLGAPRHPYTRALLASVLDPEPAARRRDRPALEVLAAEVPSPVDLPAGCRLAGRCPAVRDRCRTEPQELASLADGRAVRCWRARAGGDDALDPPAIRQEATS